MTTSTSLAPNTPAQTPPAQRLTAHVDVFESEEHFVVRADIPGVPREDVDLKFHDGTLTLEATSATSGRVFARSLSFGDDVDPDAIDASLANGVLELKLGKAAARRPRKIALA